VATDWFYFKGDQRLGPVGSQQLKDLARAGQLQPDTRIWKEGMSKPQPASRVKGLFEPAITPTPPLPVRMETAAPKESLENGQEKATLPLVLRWVRQCPNFAWGVATGTCYAVKVIVGDKMRHSEARRLKGEIAKQLAALGEKLYESGIGPADLRERIVNKDEAIQQAEGSKASTKALAKRRQALLIDLAQAALAEETIDSSFQESLQAVSTAQEASEKHEQEFAALRATRPPVDTLRAVIGAAVLCVVLLAAFGNREKSQRASSEGRSSGTTSTADKAVSSLERLSLRNGPVPVKSFIDAFRKGEASFELTSPEDGNDVAGSPFDGIPIPKKFPGPYRFYLGSISIGWGSHQRKMTIVFLADADKKLVELVLGKDMDLANPDNPINDTRRLTGMVEYLLPGSNYREAFQANIPQIMGSGATLEVGKALVVTKLRPDRKEIQVFIVPDAD
jgi:hypothetical protein